MAINRIVERRGLSQAEVAVALEINQPKLSALLHYKLEGFSVEPLMRFLAALGQDVVGQMRRRANAPAGYRIPIATPQGNSPISLLSSSKDESLPPQPAQTSVTTTVPLRKK